MSNKEQLSKLSGELFELKELLDYQPGSIVSRTLIDKEAGSFTVFALDKGQTISKHSAPHDAIATILNGTGKFVVKGEEHLMEKGGEFGD